MIVGSQVVIDGLLATILEETGTDITKVLSILNGWIIGSGNTNGSRAHASMATEILADHMPVPFAGVILATGHRVTIESAVLGTGEHCLRPRLGGCHQNHFAKPGYSDFRVE